MGRKIQEEKLQAIFQAVGANPGQKAGFLAQILGLHRSEVTRSLPSLDKHGFYLSEDERGGLWVYNKDGQPLQNGAKKRD